MNTNSRTFSKKNTIINIGDYYNRHYLYNKTRSSFNKISKKECLHPVYRKSNQIEYLFANNRLILKNRIGSNSRYGIVYLTTSTDNYKFATKLTPISFSNYNEILIATKLSNVTIKDKSPHFLIIYKVMSCNNKRLISTLPNLIKNNDYLISVNELVSGNFKNFLLDYNTNPQLIANALQQILLAVLSFHHFTGGSFHNDCHYKNFLFHKIKPGGYFHYNIYGTDIYVKNLGYIWMIWDFGLVKQDYNKKRRLEDYFRIVYFFNKYYYNEPLKNVEKILEYKNKYLSTFGDSDKKFFQMLFKLNHLFHFDIPENSKIINKRPYIIK